MSADVQGLHIFTEPVSARGRRLSFFLTPRRLLILLAAYYCLQVIIRVAMSTSVDLDEAGQVVATQKWNWGYATDPPLYTWLQMAFFRVFGVSVLGLSLLKNALLFCTCALTYQNARLAAQDERAGMAAALSLFFIGSFAWESQRDLTHSVLSATLAAATLHCLLQLHLQPSTRWYFWFGMAAGLGLISKFNYALWLAGLLLAALSLPGFRQAILDRRFFILAGLALAVFLPTGLWMLNHRDLAALTTSKLQIGHAAGWWSSVRLGLQNLVTAVCVFSAPLALIYAILFALKPKKPATPPGSETEVVIRSLLARAWLIIGAMLVVVIVASGATGFKERWFQPILIGLPVFVLLVFHRQLGRVQFKILTLLSLAVMLAVAAVMPGRLLLAQRLNREEPLTRPYRELAYEMRSILPPGTGVICDTALLAGNLRLAIPEATWAPPYWSSLFGESVQYQFICWDARRTETAPGELRRWLALHSMSLASNQPPEIFAATYRFHDAKQFKIAVQRIF